MLTDPPSLGREHHVSVNARRDDVRGVGLEGARSVIRAAVEEVDRVRYPTPDESDLVLDGDANLGRSGVEAPMDCKGLGGGFWDDKKGEEGENDEEQESHVFGFGSGCE